MRDCTKSAEGPKFILGIQGNDAISDTLSGGIGDDTIYGGNTSTDAAGNGDGNNVIDISAQTAGNDSITDTSTSMTLLETVTSDASVDVFRFLDTAAIDAGAAGSVGDVSGNDVITDMTSRQDNITATGVTVQNESNLGSVTSTTLAAANAESILTARYGAGTNAATSAYSGSADNYALVETGANTNLQVGNKATSSLTRNDFIA